MVYRALRYFVRIIREILVTYFPFIFLRKRDISKLADLKDKHMGKPAVLIGGGPSINKMNLDSYKDMVTIACNGFYLKMESLDWSPDYYTVEDPLPARDNSMEISSLVGSHKIIPYDLKKYIKDINGDTTYVDFRRSYLRPSNSRFPFFRKNDEARFYWGGTVMYFNIQLADYMGCNPIYLIGVDMSYTIPESVKRNGAVLTSLEEDSNHFDPRYFGRGKKWHLPETERMQHSFNIALKELNDRGKDLYNAGVDSNLRNVPRRMP